MDRVEKLLTGVDLKKARAMEIGALDKPVVPPTSPGVFYVDFLDTDGLRHRYRDDPGVDVGKIVDVGGVWGAQTLAEAAGDAAPVDVVVASHVLEHVPDLVTWLAEVESVLSESGSLRLALPDRRFTFDYLRKETEPACVLSAYLAKARVPQPRQVLDFALNMAEVDCGRAWSGTLDPGKLKHGYRPEDAFGLAAAAAAGAYHDVHCWVFTPASFARLMAELGRLGCVRFACEQFHDTEPNTFEFFVALRKSGNVTEVVTSWEAMVQATDRGLKDAPEMDSEGERSPRLDDVLAALARERANNARLRGALAAVEHSRSWRLTAPLRAARRLLRV
jgi:hypothetical protein